MREEKRLKNRGISCKKERHIERQRERERETDRQTEKGQGEIETRENGRREKDGEK